MIDNKTPTLRYKASRKMRLGVDQVRLGMYVAELDRPWEETPFLFQGFTVETEHDLHVLREYCREVTIDVQSSVDFQLEPQARRGSAAQSTTLSVSKRSREVEQELSRAQRTHLASSRLVRTILDDVKLGKSVDTAAAREAVTECVDSVIANPDAMTLLSRIREKDDYTAQHALSVSVLTVALGRHIGMERHELVDLGLCGLLHDVGKVMVPIEILTKPGRLTEDEMVLMREHTTHGRNILMSGKGSVLKAVDVAHAHHERFDGGGYPRGLVESQIGLYTRMVAIIDTFDAVTTDRAYGSARHNMDAFRILSKGRGSHWDPKLVIRFIETIGIYPAGTPVELSNQMIGIVVETHPTLKLRPKVLLTHGPNGPLQPPVLLDLARHQADRHGQRLEVRDILSPRVAGVSLHELRSRGVLDNLHNLPDFASVDRPEAS